MLDPVNSGFGDLDDVDRKILEYLGEDGRASMTTLAEHVHISRANAYARVDRMTKEGIVEGFSVRVSPTAMGLGVSAYIGLTILQESWQTVREALTKVDGVEHIALCSGDVDVVVLVRTPDIASVRDLVLEGIRSIPGVEQTRTSIVLDEVTTIGPTRRAPDGGR